MKNPLGIGLLGHYGAVRGVLQNDRVNEMNKLVDEWNAKIPEFEDAAKQQEFMDEWQERMIKINSDKMPAKKAATKVAKKTAAPKSEVKKEKKHFAVVMERKHGFFPFRHAHYHVNVLELDATASVKDVEDAAKKAARLAKRVVKVELRLLTVEEVDIANDEFVAKKLAEITTK